MHCSYTYCKPPPLTIEHFSSNFTAYYTPFLNEIFSLQFALKFYQPTLLSIVSSLFGCNFDLEEAGTQGCRLEIFNSTIWATQLYIKANLYLFEQFCLVKTKL